MTLPKPIAKLYKKRARCPVCDKKLVMYKPNALYCSTKCRMRAYRARKHPVTAGEPAAVS